MQISRLSDALGVEITGIDLATAAGPEVDAIRDAFHEHQLIVFRDQKLTPDQHIAFSRHFGEHEIHISKKFLLADHPEILVLSNRKEKGEYIGVENAGDYWHSDLSYMTRPSLGSLLYALEVPPEGGDTEWANQYAAYETLPGNQKADRWAECASHLQPLSKSAGSYSGSRKKEREAAIRENQSGRRYPPDCQDPSGNRAQGALCVAALYHRYRGHAR